MDFWFHFGTFWEQVGSEIGKGVGRGSGGGDKESEYGTVASAFGLRWGDLAPAVVEDIALPAPGEREREREARKAVKRK